MPSQSACTGLTFKKGSWLFQRSAAMCVWGLWLCVCQGACRKPLTTEQISLFRSQQMYAWLLNPGKRTCSLRKTLNVTARCLPSYTSIRSDDNKSSVFPFSACLLGELSDWLFIPVSFPFLSHQIWNFLLPPFFAQEQPPPPPPTTSPSSSSGQDFDRSQWVTQRFPCWKLIRRPSSLCQLLGSPCAVPGDVDVCASAFQQLGKFGLRFIMECTQTFVNCTPATAGKHFHQLKESRPLFFRLQFDYQHDEKDMNLFRCLCQQPISQLLGLLTILCMENPSGMWRKWAFPWGAWVCWWGWVEGNQRIGNASGGRAGNKAVWACTASGYLRHWLLYPISLQAVLIRGGGLLSEALVHTCRTKER